MNTNTDVLTQGPDTHNVAGTKGMVEPIGAAQGAIRRRRSFRSGEGSRCETGAAPATVTGDGLLEAELRKSESSQPLVG
jgi:hypothetical protein